MSLDNVLPMSLLHRLLEARGKRGQTHYLKFYHSTVGYFRLMKSVIPPYPILGSIAVFSMLVGQRRGSLIVTHRQNSGRLDPIDFE